MALVFKHEALLTFVGRLLRDREFSEWFVAQPRQALASHGLRPSDVQDMADILASDRHRPRLARALRPTMTTFLDLIDKERSYPVSDDLVDRLARLDRELRATRDRLAAVRSESHPWWKFWEWE